MHTSYVFAVPMNEKSVGNILQAYLSGTFHHKGGSITILSNNRTELKCTVLNEAYEQLGIKILSSSLFHPQGNSRIENVHNFLMKTLTMFLESSNLE